MVSTDAQRREPIKSSRVVGNHFSTKYVNVGTGGKNGYQMDESRSMSEPTPESLFPK